MTTIRLGPFGGCKPILSPRLLPDGMAVVSLNHRTDQGDLRPWNAALDLTLVPAGRQTIYALSREAPTDPLIWLTWATRVHAIGGFRAEDATKRTYYTGDGAPKVTDNVIGLAGYPYPSAYRDLGVPKPLTAPTLTQTTAGTGTDEDRFYAYAYVTDWDEVGMPQIAGPITCKPGAIIAIGNLSLPPSGVGENRGINRIRVWRTVSGASSTEFYFLRDITPATSTTDDARSPGADVLDSALYAVPPSNLKSLHALWNGMAAGITGKSVRYCEVNKLHAWPAKYETLCVETPIELASWERNLLITTVGRPRLVTGSSPEAMDDTPVDFIAGNVSAAATVSFGHGVCWPTKEGLAYVGNLRAPSIITKDILTPEQWAAMQPELMFANQYRGLYIGWYYDSPTNTFKGFEIDPAAPEKGIRYLSSAGLYYPGGSYYDKLGGNLYLLGNNNYVKQWNAGSALTVTHRSKVFRMPKPGCLPYARIISDSYPVTLTVKASGQADFVRTVTNERPFTMKTGFRADTYQFELATTGNVLGAVFSDDPAEFAQT